MSILALLRQPVDPAGAMENIRFPPLLGGRFASPTASTASTTTSDSPKLIR